MSGERPSTGDPRRRGKWIAFVLLYLAGVAALLLLTSSLKALARLVL
jgi:hypothetical protein